MLALWLVGVLATIGLAPLFDYDETVYAQTALDMMRHGDWLTPQANGMRFFEKPAFVYYLMDASFAVFGDHAFAARLPSALFTLGTALLLIRAGRRLADAATGWLAAVIYVSMLEVGLLARAAILDPALNFFVAGALLQYLIWKREGQPRDIELAALFAGLAVSVKGPVGIVAPGLVIALDWWFDRRQKPWANIPWLRATFLFLLAALPWYVAQAVVNGVDFLYEFIWVHNIERALHPMQGHGGRWYYYLVVFSVSILPWLAWMPDIAQWGWREAREKRPHAQAARLCLIWVVAIIGLFTLASTKLPHYISSVYPGAALLAALALRHAAPKAGIARRIGIALPSALLGILLLALPWLWPMVPDFVHHPRALAIVTQHIAPGLGVAAAGAILILSSVALIARRDRPIMHTAILGLILQLTLFSAPAMFAGKLIQGPLERIAAEAKKLPPDTPLLSLHLNAPSVSFESGRNYRMVQTTDLARMARQGKPFAVFLRAEHQSELARALPLPAPRVNQGGYLLYEFKAP